MKTNKKGFTLIELLVVIAIIGLLSTLAVVALNSARQKSRDSKRVADVKQIQTALELYFADSTNGYPEAATAITLGDTNQKSLCTGGWKTGCGTADTTYMGLVPAAPTPADNPAGSTACTAGNTYAYTAPVGGATYQILFCLGGKVGDLTAGMRTANANGIQ
ncbi:MAG: type II secretion system protein [Patescibacteria group bacterium]|nr:type II secretion system protein [Patescibacteria group bacterium]